jgi:hypothetical protein
MHVRIRGGMQQLPVLLYQRVPRHQRQQVPPDVRRRDRRDLVWRAPFVSTRPVHASPHGAAPWVSYAGATSTMSAPTTRRPSSPRRIFLISCGARQLGSVLAGGGGAHAGRQAANLGAGPVSCGRLRLCECTYVPVLASSRQRVEWRWEMHTSLRGRHPRVDHVDVERDCPRQHSPCHGRGRSIL